MTTETTTEPQTVVIDLLQEEEKPAIPPISVERALECCGALDSIYNDDMDESDFTSLLETKSLVAPSSEIHYTDPDCLHVLEGGGCLFTFLCRHELDSHQAEMLNSVVNLSAFDDETTENFVPHYEYGAESEYTFLLARAAYVLVGVNIQELLSNPSLLSTCAYQQSCQPAATTIWEDYENMERDNFRITKPIIPYVYNFTIQFRVSGIRDAKVLERLARHVGTRIDPLRPRRMPPSNANRCCCILYYKKESCW
jgi:hypothetical protein